MTLEVRIEPTMHSTAKQRSDMLGFILNVGIRPDGKMILRSKAQPKNPEKSPTANWWNQAIDDVKNTNFFL